MSRDFKVLPGPIGSGEAVVANKDAEIRSFLRRFNDKTLALETETGGLAAAFYEAGRLRCLRVVACSASVAFPTTPMPGKYTTGTTT